MMNFFTNFGKSAEPLSMKVGDSKRFRNSGLPHSLSVPSLPCIDVYPSQDFKFSNQDRGLGAIFLADAIWRQGQQGMITITFGTANCNGCSTQAAWSYIGNQSNQFSNVGMPSMNLGWCDPPQSSFSIDGFTFDASQFAGATRNYCRSGECWPGWVPGATVLHEFGHALGMMHEHQNNSQQDNPLVLNVQNIKDYYINLYGGDVGAGENAAQVNMIDRYTCDSEMCDFKGSTFDTNSIMLYAIPDEWIVGENPTYPNFVFSAKDKKWLEMMYPKNSSTKPQLKVRFLDGADWQKYWVKKVVTEQLAPIVGIDFDFDLPSNVATEPPVTTPPPVTVAPTAPPVTIPPTEPPIIEPTVAPTEPPVTEPPVTVAPTEPPVTVAPTEPPVTTEPPTPPPKPTIAPMVTDDAYKIYWGTSSEWYSWTQSEGYPRPQGNIPMYGVLTNNAQNFLMHQYHNVHPSGM